MYLHIFTFIRKNTPFYYILSQLYTNVNTVFDKNLPIIPKSHETEFRYLDSFAVLTDAC